MKKESKYKKILTVLGGIVFCLAILFFTSIIIFNKVYEYHGVVGFSMSPTLNKTVEDEDGIYLRKNKKSNIGDIIVSFNPNSNKYVIKRLIALENDKVAIEKKLLNGEFIYKIWVLKNGETVPKQYKLLGQDYFTNNTLYNDFYNEGLSYKTFICYGGLNFLEIPENNFFYIGDNQTESTSSYDCADYGPVSMKNYVGRVEFIIRGRKNFIPQIIKQTFKKI